ncbi:endopeptidase La [Ureaplasma canigenitalium]|uniref:endopeptidase La n=1 Tax=Ureaplasma canigenitalium TaxID=42092 RepID=UPI0004E0D230|nr:endopeptidase La [Ureaplasma canigenitalium]
MNKKPVIFARAAMILPYDEERIEIGRTNSLHAIDLAYNTLEKELIIVTQRDPDIDEIDNINQIYEIGTLVEIVDLEGSHKNGYSLTVRSKEIVNVSFPEPLSKDTIMCEYETRFDLKKVRSDVEKKIDDINLEILNTIENRDDKNIKLDFDELIAFSKYKKYEFPLKALSIFQSRVFKKEYEVDNIADKFKLINQKSFLGLAEDILILLFKSLINPTALNDDIEKQIADKINYNLQRQQREYFLREKLKVVKNELGKFSGREDDAEKMRKKIEESGMPSDVKERVLQELSRFENAMSSNESGIIKTYLDWMIELPWKEVSTDNKDLVSVKKTLDRNHYGIEKVKERIVEYLSLRLRNPHIKGPIICLVGPPGVGKTSLVKSIAEALDKKFIKVSLGGVRDEAEIRGHRKTYVGAMPGRIIKGMKKAGVLNPLFLLDEIDKMTADNRGDPASAMLEVLDPEQNKFFSDHYIEEEYDLSKVMFMATANYYQQIPYALIDRLEIIELSSYTAIEKREIAKSHLLERIYNDALITEKELVINDDALDFIIEHYTKEAGVRELERQLSHIVRKYVVENYNSSAKKSKKDNEPTILTKELIIKYLGKIKYDFTKKDETTIPGIVNGMAYTSAGGDLLPIEVNYSTNGKGGNVIITGNLEKTMNESVNVALGFVKANAAKYGIDTTKINFKEIDIHVHVPQGGIPKDGPSAGIAITTAIISALTNRPVSTNISMTGEIMLRGLVGIIGGVKEKVISAYRAGVREIFMPIDDERFLEEIPGYILNDLKIHLVKHYDEVYNSIFKKTID